jgi:epoxyqueuosine reductase
VSKLDKKEQIIKFCNSLNLDLVGFTKCRVFWELESFFKYRKNMNLENEFEEKEINKRINPNLLMDQGKTIISIAFPYIYNLLPNGEFYFSRYTRGEDYHKVIRSYLDKIVCFIESLGGTALAFVDNNPLPERYIANLSGIGFIGKNNMIITEKYGSFVFLGEIITDLEIEESKELDIGCGNCNECFSKCPSGSINEKYCNPNICLSYITQKKHIEDKWFKKLNGRVFGCDSCQMACPYNKEVKFSKLKEFKPLEHMENIDLEQVVRMDNKAFNEKYKITSCGWRGKNMLIRNALINYMVKYGPFYGADNINSPYVKDYNNRLLKLFNL